MPHPYRCRALPCGRPSRCQKVETGSERGGERSQDHDDADGDVDLFPTQHVGQAPEGERAEEGTEDGGTGDPAGLQGAQVPLGGDQGGHCADHEEVVGVGEEADSRDEDRPAMEFAVRRLVQEVGDGSSLLTRGFRNFSDRRRRRERAFGRLGRERTSLSLARVNTGPSEDERYANTSRIRGYPPS